MVLGIKPKASHMPGNHSTTVPHFWPWCFLIIECLRRRKSCEQFASSAKSEVLIQEWCPPSRDIWQCLESYVDATIVPVADIGDYGHPLRAGMLLNIPQGGQPLIIKSDPFYNVTVLRLKNAVLIMHSLREGTVSIHSRFLHFQFYTKLVLYLSSHNV